MHIKQITISNFRSFRQQPEIQPFSPLTNTVVGRNGSGKSNLFDAVQFCLLAPRFANLRQEERQALLHEGSGSAAVNAFVEIVFDNSDHRFQLENSDEVVLRRTVGLKKDEFFLQRKRATKSEIQSLLEGAGFSKSNPYFIVQQGKVQDLCIMSDANRLKLLKEVAGTTLYDEKKAESLAKMDENTSSIAKITEILSDIEKRLDELQEEKDELTEYQKADKARRAAEYCLYDRELRKARSQLDAVEHERAEHAESIAELHDSLKTNHDAIRQIEAVMKSKSNLMKRNRNQLQHLEEDNKEAVQSVTRLQLECREIEDQIKSGVEQEGLNIAELNEVEQEIEKTENLLSENVQPQYDEISKKVDEISDEREAAIAQAESLYAKQARGRQFATKSERDVYLRSNESELLNARIEKEKELTKQQNTLRNVQKALEKDSASVEDFEKEVAERKNTLQSINKSLNEKKRQRAELLDARREDWRKAEECNEILSEAKESLSAATADMAKVMPKATSMGLKALDSIVSEEKLKRGENYFGMLMENMQLVDDKYRTAVEVAAQNSLFHVIVDTDHTAARLMKRLELGKLGRITFLPLNQLRIENVTYPESNDVRPLLDLCLNYDSKVSRAMHHVFNKKLIARSSEVAAEWSSKCSMDAITLDGDLCGRKGALTGGYVDLTKSRLGAQSRLRESSLALESAQRDYQAFNRKAQEVDQEITNLLQELQRVEAKHSELNHHIFGRLSEIERLKTRIEAHKKKIENFEKISIPVLCRSIASLEADVSRLQAELATELQENLSDDEREMLNLLNSKKKKLASEIEIQNGMLEKVAVQRQELLSLLEDNLRIRRKELVDGNYTVDLENDGLPSVQKRISLADLQSQRKDDLEEKERELEQALKNRDSLQTRLDHTRKVENELLVEFNDAKNELESLKNQSMTLAKEMEESQDTSERLLNKRSMCISKRETYIRKIQELGSLPPPTELEKFDGKSISELMKSLETFNKKLKKYSHVNKKAYDQYVNFSEQRESLLKRKEELDRGAEKVKELIDSLDKQKDEAINRTFRGVSTHFKDVFKELVPNGEGELLLRTSLDKSSNEDLLPSKSVSISRNDDGSTDISLYQGITIKVRFTSVGENYMMSQLSGGQKALVALALIFAIQRCDPAPFYLFDELDQALDSTYRASVASLIQRQASSAENPTQFIVSTFRQELVSVANRCFGISHQNKVSNLHPLSKKDAQTFIANLMSEEEAVGRVTNFSSIGTVRTSPETKKRRTSSIVESQN